MKKAILTLGLFSMMMILTSFTSPSEKSSAPVQVKAFEIGSDTQTKPKEPKTLNPGVSVVIGDTQTKPKEPKPLDPVAIGDTQTKPKEPKPLDPVAIGDTQTKPKEPKDLNPGGLA